MTRISNALRRTCLLLPVLALLGACQSPTDERSADVWIAHLETRTEKSFTRCESPRPEMCTMIYQPVCALVEDDEECLEPPCSAFQYRTLGNSCSACGLAEVIGHVEDECPDDLSTPED